MSDTKETSHRRILVIDDNTAIHDDFKKILSSIEGGGEEIDNAEAALFGSSLPKANTISFELDSAFQGQEGLELVQRAMKENRPYAMAFVDVRMPPGWDGIETVARIWREYPDLQVVICTAYSDYSLEEILKQLGESDQLVVLKKPFDNIEVLQLAHALTAKWRLLQQSKAKTEELERRVAARTRELQGANEKLHAEMVERTRAEEALRQSQKMEAVGQLAGGIAHDFNNLLTVIQGYTACLLDDGQIDSRAHQSLQQVAYAAERAANLTRQLLAFSRKQMMQPEDLDLNETIGQVAKLLHRVLGEDIALQIQAEEGLPGVHADRAMIEQVLLNLAVNARDAMPRGGRLVIQSTAVKFSEAEARKQPRIRAGDFVCVSVTDNGCGIASEVMPHLFEPFFTTKEVGKGTGLGLATAYGIISQHGGWIEAESPQGQGARFKFFLPAASKPAVPVAVRPHAPAAVAGGKETILLVEDELSLRNLARKILQRYGYTVHTAGSGVDALKVWAEHADQIDLLLTDMVMPDGMSGRDLAKQLQTDRPEIKVIYSSGYSLELVCSDALMQEGINFLAKPYPPDKLARMVRNCLDETPQPAAPANVAL